MAQISEKELKKLERLLNLPGDNALVEFDALNELENRVEKTEEGIFKLESTLAEVPTNIEAVKSELEEKIKTIELTPGEKGCSC